MRTISESNALLKLAVSKRRFANMIRERFEFRAKSCATCKTPGACCLDRHFVNVRISRLEAVAIGAVLDELPENMRKIIGRRIENSIERYGLRDDREPAAKTFACPLYEPSMGCLVHNKAKPAACISHACYEQKEDLPPDEVQAAEEEFIDQLNTRAYGAGNVPLPLPVAVERILSRTANR